MGAIKVNGRKRPEKYRLQVGDVVTRNEQADTNKSSLDATQTKQQKVARLDVEKIRKQLVFEDANRLVFDKPADLVVHPWNKHTTDITMHDMLLSYLEQTDGVKKSATFKPAFCYRLDKDTSGIIIAAKNFRALQTLNELIRLRKTSKQYKAVVGWRLDEPVTIAKPLFVGFDKKLGRGKTFINAQQGKEAITILKPIHTVEHDKLGPVTLLSVTLVTGRMHQIRVHSASVDLPVIGDLIYGNPALNRLANKSLSLQRQLLHCESYWFFDPFLDKQVNFVAPLPEDFTRPFGFVHEHT